MLLFMGAGEPWKIYRAHNPASSLSPPCVPPPAHLWPSWAYATEAPVAAVQIKSATCMSGHVTGLRLSPRNSQCCRVWVRRRRIEVRKEEYSAEDGTLCDSISCCRRGNEGPEEYIDIPCKGVPDRLQSVEASSSWVFKQNFSIQSLFQPVLKKKKITEWDDEKIFQPSCWLGKSKPTLMPTNMESHEFKYTSLSPLKASYWPARLSAGNFSLAAASPLSKWSTSIDMDLKTQS